MPVFEGLFPEPHDDIVQDLLFTLAEWQALAKLRLHTDTTLQFLNATTTLLGQSLRHFKDEVCEAFRTCELPREEAARGRRTAAKTAKGTGEVTTSAVAKPKATGPRQRKFNLQTYKLHALGDYGATILRFGTSDNYTTQIVCVRLPYVIDQ